MTKQTTRVETEGMVTDVTVEVPENEPVAWPKEAELETVGKPTERVDGPEKVTGQAKYTYDVNLPDMVWMKILHSSLPHARIRKIDSERARALDGVLAVLVPGDVPKLRIEAHQSLLLTDTARFVGDEIAAVVAETEAIAREAVTLLDVDAEELPFVVDAEKAREEGAPRIHEDPGLMGPQPYVYERGNVEQGLAEADHVIEQTFRSQTQVHACLETHCSVARWEGSKLTVWDSTQAVHPNRQSLAEALGIPLANVRVIGLYSGGGFGSKLWLNKHTILAALAARELGRPVKMVYDRADEAMSTGNRPGNVMTLRAGCKSDGTLTALELKSLGAVGAYRWWATCGAPLREIYRCASARTEEDNVHINADTARPHRAPGHVQGTWALEQAIDMLAEKCGLDPLEFRLRNHCDVDQRRNLPYSTKGLREAYAQGAARIGWADRERHKRTRSTGAKRRGFGMATQVWGGLGGPPGYVIVHLYSDATLAVFSGAQDIGTATRTAVLQVVCEELTLPIERARIVMGDTQGTPYGYVSGGSRTAPTQTPAARLAAVDVKRQLLDFASAQMDVPAARLALQHGDVVDTEDARVRKSIADVMAEKRFDFFTDEKDQNMIVGKGWRGPNPDDVEVRSWGAQFAEVEVDVDTGEVKVIHVVAAHEVGRLLNPLAASSQVEGGVIQGIGFALFEERVLNERSGRMVNANLHDYKLPTSMDIPVIEPIFIDLPDAKANNTGVKGLGEPPIIPTAAAIANAVYDAIGVRVTQVPMTPKRVLDALSQA
jgi:CO/xanthine dehydrogenase Mo-binding subunit